ADVRRSVHLLVGAHGADGLHVRVEAEGDFGGGVVAGRVTVGGKDIAPGFGLCAALDLGNEAFFDGEDDVLLERADGMRGQIENDPPFAGALDRANMCLAIRKGATTAAIVTHLEDGTGDGTA